MASTERRGSAASKTGVAILDAAEQIMVEDGYSAVTSRSVATRAGLHAGNVHYYFPTMDDLFIALLDRGADKSLERMAAAFASPRPFATFWRLASNRRGLALLDELMAAARHRPALRERVVALAELTRRMQTEALRALIPQYHLDDDIFPPELLAAAIQGTALLVAREEALGIDTQHTVATKAVEELIDRLEDRRRI
jgi:AcrR family transcriptional regulator